MDTGNPIEGSVSISYTAPLQPGTVITCDPSGITNVPRRNVNYQWYTYNPTQNKYS